jgi:hypothetical protein
MRVLVLGSGPAGLFAAQAAMDAHARNGESGGVAVISVREKSPLYGAQYLHSPIPGVTPAEGRSIAYELRGTSSDYRRKVYGQAWDGNVSPEDLGGHHTGWDIRATYDKLWARWFENIMDDRIDPARLRHHLHNDQPHLVINSIPKPQLCYDPGHNFSATEVWAAGDAPALGITLPYRCMFDSVVCNGEEYPSWYRMSNVFGHTTVEWPGTLAQVPITTASRVKKPLSHNCDCWQSGSPPWLDVGRYGEWSKGVLSHTAYFRAYKRVDEMIGAASAAAEAGA